MRAKPWVNLKNKSRPAFAGKSKESLAALPLGRPPTDHLTLYKGIRIMSPPLFADVAELADAQVSEACDGDIVEVQVLSSAP